MTIAALVATIVLFIAACCMMCGWPKQKGKP